MTTAPVGSLDGEQAIRDALAAGPAPGPWNWDGEVWDYDPENEAPWLVDAADKRVLWGGIKCDSAANARLIAACNPETMRALLAELDRLRSASRQEGWQPIADAPKDGTRFLAVCDTGLVRLVRWDDKWDRFPIGDEPGGCWPTAPTHYMPLPAAPHQAQEAQGDRHE
jgi:hypothetical protein